MIHLNAPENKIVACCIAMSFKYEEGPNGNVTSGFLCLKGAKNKCEYETIILAKKLLIDCSRKKTAVSGPELKNEEDNMKKGINAF